MLKILISGMMGNVLEWYDYVLYAYVANIIGATFFPTADPYTHLLEAFGIFAIGFCSRPVGGVLLGWLGDVYGRKKALMLSVLLMACPMAVLALLPGCATWGVWAAVGLCLCRLVHGLALGGEYGGSSVYVVESAPRGRWGVASSMVEGSTVLGLLMGSGVVLLLQNVMGLVLFQAWGWRLAFALEAVLAFVTLYLRSGLCESPVFIEAVPSQPTAQSPLKQLITGHWPALVLGIGIELGCSFTYYLSATFLSLYLISIKHYSASIIHSTVFFSQWVMLLCTFLGGYLSDVFSTKTVMLSVYVLLAIVAWPLCGLLDVTGTAPNLFGVQVAIFVFAAIAGVYLGPLAASFCELFPTHVRATGVSVANNIGSGLFGGVGPLILTALLHNATSSVGLVYMIWSVVAFVIVVFACFKPKFLQSH